jgi:multiple sugar transport system ATP-binding protein
VVPATVEVVELLGNEAVFHARAGEDVLIAKAEPHEAPSVGGRVSLQLDLEQLHLFDADTQRRLE